MLILEVHLIGLSSVKYGSDSIFGKTGSAPLIYASSDRLTVGVAVDLQNER